MRMSLKNFYLNSLDKVREISSLIDTLEEFLENNDDKVDEFRISQLREIRRNTIIRINKGRKE